MRGGGPVTVEAKRFSGGDQVHWRPAQGAAEEVGGILLDLNSVGETAGIVVGVVLFSRR
jgi:hypothetical protein